MRIPHVLWSGISIYLQIYTIPPRDIFPSAYSLRISQATIYFFLLFSQLVYLTKAYNLCHQVAIRWTNEKRDKAQQGPKPHCTSTWSQVVRLHEASQCSFKAPLYGYEATLLGFMKPRRDKCHLNLWISRQLGHTRPRH